MRRLGEWLVWEGVGRDGEALVGRPGRKSSLGIKSSDRIELVASRAE